MGQRAPSVFEIYPGRELEINLQPAWWGSAWQAWGGPPRTPRRPVSESLGLVAVNSGASVRPGECTGGIDEMKLRLEPVDDSPGGDGGEAVVRP